MDWFSDRSPGSLPLIVGHRGASADAPENTLAAFILAIEQGADGIEFDVHNPGAMPRNVQLQVFQRSFTSKGDGRGLGTYSMKLLSERYLGGRVSFTSEAVSGTTFSAWYPLHLP